MSNTNNWPPWFSALLSTAYWVFLTHEIFTRLLMFWSLHSLVSDRSFLMVLKNCHYLHHVTILSIFRPLHFLYMRQFNEQVHNTYSIVHGPWTWLWFSVMDLDLLLLYSVITLWWWVWWLILSGFFHLSHPNLLPACCWPGHDLSRSSSFYSYR